MSLKFLALVLWSVIRQRAFALKPVAGGLSGVTVTPQGAFLPQMAGGDKTPEEEQAEAEAAEKRAEEEREAAEEEARKAEEEAEKGPPEWGELDKEKAERAVRNARAAEKKAKEDARKAREEAAELRKAQETEQETVKRELGEKRAESEQLRTAADNLLINEAIRDAAGELDVPVKKHRRLLRLVEREGITIDDDRNVQGAQEAVEAVLDEFPEFKVAAPPADPNDEDPPDNPGGNPDRRRRNPDLTPEAVAKMAKHERDRFNQLFDEGKIPASALAGLKT